MRVGLAAEANVGTISVIIPNYNRADLIGQTLGNVLAQSRPPDEVIVVDDGSTDGSVAVIEQFTPRVRLIQQPNAGPAAARNAGLEIARGDLVQFMDSDDLWSRYKLERQASALEGGVADFAMSPWAPVSFRAGSVWIENHVVQQALPAPSVPYYCWMMRGWSTIFQSCLFKRSFIEGVGRYRLDLMPSEDSELFFRMLTRQPRIVFAEGCLTLYRIHGQGQITNSGTNERHRVLDQLRFFRCVLEEIDRAALEPDLLSWAALWARIVDHHRLLERLGPMPAEQRDGLVQDVEAVQRLTGRIYSTVDRIARHLRGRWRGSRLGAPYQSAPVTAQQVAEISSLGFSLQHR